jgi:uncharacterized SAM-binding protein YcdF (DUF218 family)
MNPNRELTAAGPRAADRQIAARPLRPMRALVRATVIACSVTAMSVMAGFVWFAGNAAGLAGPVDPRADAIVVLTGDSARIDTALGLLAEGRAARLLISGVNPAVSSDALARTYGAEFGHLLACCVDLGRAARDTLGNAAETLAWVEQQGFVSLLVVTSDYHMARSMAELADAIPEVALSAVPIASPELHAGDWWRDPSAIALMAREYGKYLLTMARLTLSPTPREAAGGG